MSAVNQDHAYTLTAKEMAEDLGVETRTILRYITKGYSATDGTKMILPARLKRGPKGGHAWHARPADYQDFKARLLQGEQGGQARHNGHVPSAPGTNGDHLANHLEDLRQALTSIAHLSASIESLSRRLEHLETTVEQLRTPDPSVHQTPEPSLVPATTQTGEAGCLRLTHHLDKQNRCITTTLEFPEFLKKER